MPKTPSSEIPRHKRLDAEIRDAMTHLGKAAGHARDGIGGRGVGEAESAGLDALAAELDDLRAQAAAARHRLWKLVV